MNERLIPAIGTMAPSVRNWVSSDLSAFGQLERVLHINA